ncbi:MAG: shikimate kinase, partial [Roseiflexaceae bacterium]
MNRTANKSNCIVLVGLSGAGKSTVGRYLALKLNYPLCDTDAIIESEAGQAASAIFAARGETAFRALESEVLQRVMAAPPVVVATGGGIVTVAENRTLIKAHAFVVWLDATTNAIVTRIT